MSLREVPSSKPLLARKGAASPANLRTLKGGLAESSLRAVEDSREIALETANPETAADPKASEAGDRVSETIPAASLLPFDLLRKKYRPDLSPDLVEDEPDMVIGDLAADDRAETWRLGVSPQAELALHGKPALKALMPTEPPKLRATPAPDFRVDSGSDSKLDVKIESHEEVSRTAAAQASPSHSAPAPTPNPDWRVGAADTTAPKRASRAGMLLPLGALAAAFAALIVGWAVMNPTLDLASRDVPNASQVAAPIASGEAAGETAAPVAVEPPPPVAAVEAPKLPKTGAVAVPESPEAPAVAPALPTSKLPAPNMSTSAPLAPKLPTAAAPAAVEPIVIKPTVDVVRLEANGEAVIAGRAAPNSELIVLDKGEPIGTTRADAFGEWVFVPETALPIGDHEFGLVVKTVQESVSMPAPSKPSLPPAPAIEPAATAPDSAVEGPSVPSVPSAPKAPEPAASTGAAPADETSSAPAVAPAAGDSATNDSALAGVSVPIPVRRPAADEMGAAPGSPLDVASAATATADFVVQLASVKTRDGAHQEWRKLQQRFPDILADMVPALDEVKLAEYGTVFRIRTGAFSNQREAASLCARLVSKNQECLVVRVSTGN